MQRIHTMILPPPSLFKYQPYTNRAVDNLVERRIWFSAPCDFNDPYDCGFLLRIKEPTDSDLHKLAQHLEAEDPGSVISDPRYMTKEGYPTEYFRATVMNSAESAMRARVQENYWRKGVSCFSERPDDMLLWAHYGGSYRGFCLEFRTSAELFRKIHRVRYVNRIPALDSVDALVNREKDDSFLDMVLTKSSPWSYEREWRLLHVRPSLSVRYGDALVAVYLGSAMPFEHKLHISRLLHGTSIKLYDVVCDASEYSLRVEELDGNTRASFVT